MARWLFSALGIVVASLALWLTPERAHADESVKTSCELIRSVYPGKWRALVSKGKCQEVPLASSSSDSACANKWFPCGVNTPVGCGSSSACDPVGSVSLVRSTDGVWRTDDGELVGENLFEDMSLPQLEAFREASEEYRKLVELNRESTDLRLKSNSITLQDYNLNIKDYRSKIQLYKGNMSVYKGAVSQ